MSTVTPTTPLVSPPRHIGKRSGLARLAWTELRLLVREPVVLTFVFAFPVITTLVLGNVFDPGDTAFEGVDPAQWYIAAYVGVVLAGIGLITLPVHLAGYRHEGVVRRFRVSLFPTWALPAAQMLVGVVMTLVGMVALLIVAGFAYGIPAVEDPAMTTLGLVLGIATFVSIGAALGSVLPNARSAQGMGMLLFLPSFLLGGGGPPPDAMGDTMQRISDLIPLTHAIRSIQEPWLDVGTPSDHLVILTGWLVAANAVWLWRARRTEG